MTGASTSDDVVDCLLAAAVDHGLDPRADRLVSIAGIYREFARRYDTAERRNLLTGFTRMIEDRRGPGLALEPFLRFDPDPVVVSSAALSVSVMFEGAGPLGGPGAVIGLAFDDGIEPFRATRMLQGVLLLGDRRLLPDLAEARRRLDDDRAREELTRAWSGLAYASVVEFFLDWLEEEPGPAEFGAVAAAIARVARDASVPFVLDVERWYPVWSSPDGEPFRVLSTEPLFTHAETIAPRLRDLARRESEPRILPSVLAFWGLEA